MTISSDARSGECPHLRAGREALTLGAWDEARDHFSSSLAHTETPEALKGLADAAFAVSDSALAISSHERAYALHRERGDARAAARMALALSWDVRVLRGDVAVADGWLERAGELLEGLGDVPERGWLMVRHADGRLMPAREFAEVLRLTARAREIARAHDDFSLDMEALALEGSALLHSGEIVDGLRRLDQAAAATASGEVGDHVSAGNILCRVLSGYEAVLDFDRAAQWIDSLQAFTGRQRVRPLASLCRSHFAGLMIVRGRWQEAEAALEPAADLVPFVGQVALVRLGELRLRQGRLDEAEELFTRAAHLPDAQLGLAALALERGDARTALDRVERHQRRLPGSSGLDRARGLTIEALARITLGDTDAAAAIAEELAVLATGAGTIGLVARARYVQAEVAIARGELDVARRAFEDAIDGYGRAGQPFERAAARLGLARALRSLSRPEPAREEAQHAHEEFADLGARTAASEASALAASLAQAGNGDAAKRPILSRREIEVLELVAQGLSNKEVASRLFLSEHTIKRHLANILARLELPSRAAAAAYAIKQGLL